MAINTMDGFSGARRLKKAGAPSLVQNAFAEIERGPNIVHVRNRLGHDAPVHPIAAVVGLLVDGVPRRQTIFFDIKGGYEKTVETETDELLEELRDDRRLQFGKSIVDAIRRATAVSTELGDTNVFDAWHGAMYGSSASATFGGIVRSVCLERGNLLYTDIYCNRRAGGALVDGMRLQNERSYKLGLWMKDRRFVERIRLRAGIRPLSLEEMYAMSIVNYTLPHCEPLSGPIHVH